MIILVMTEFHNISILCWNVQMGPLWFNFLFTSCTTSDSLKNTHLKDQMLHKSGEVIQIAII